MLLPNYFLVLLMTLPILIESIPQNPESHSTLQDCYEDSDCRDGQFCGSGTCSACNIGGCGPGSNCGYNQDRIFECRCPDKTQGDPWVECLSSTGCIHNAHCGKDEICKGKRCLAHPCLTATCGSNNECILVIEEIQCQPIPVAANVGIGNRQNNMGAGVPESGTQGGGMASGTQAVSQGGFNQNVNNGGVSHGGNSRGTVQHENQLGTTQASNSSGAGHVSNPGGSSQGGTQASVDQGTIHGVTDLGGQQVVTAPGANQGSTTQSSIQSGTTQGSNQNVPSARPKECQINSQCQSNEHCKSGSCIDPCVSIRCGDGAVCHVAQRQGQCVCPPGSEGNPHRLCRPITENPLNAANQPPTTSKIPTSNSGTDDVGFPGDNSNSGQRERNGCLNTPNPGECRAAFKRFYYNIETDQCDCFFFGGCDEEVEAKYSWVTLEECQRICLPGNKSQGPGCKRASLEEVTAFLEEERRRRENNSN